jgi:hypothetical protein
MITDILIWIPFISLLIYLPSACYADLKWREIPHLWWLPLWIVNTPVMLYLYGTGFYPFYALPISLVMAGIFWMMHRLDFIQGADTIWLWSISLFFVVNPLGWPHGPEQFIFYIYLMAMMILTAPALFFLNLRRGHMGSLRVMMSEWPGGVPLILPISAALILAVVFG